MIELSTSQQESIQRMAERLHSELDIPTETTITRVQEILRSFPPTNNKNILKQYGLRSRIKAEREIVKDHILRIIGPVEDTQLLERMTEAASHEAFECLNTQTSLRERAERVASELKAMFENEALFNSCAAELMELANLPTGDRKLFDRQIRDRAFPLFRLGGSSLEECIRLATQRLKEIYVHRKPEEEDNGVSKYQLTGSGGDSKRGSAGGGRRVIRSGKEFS